MEKEKGTQKKKRGHNTFSFFIPFLRKGDTTLFCLLYSLYGKISESGAS
jgi:hypothetical protein